MNDERADHTAGLPPDATDRELFAARITAHALGQLDAAEAAEIERLLADPAQNEARQQVAEIRRLAGAIRYAPDEAGLARSAALRRTVLAAAAAARPAAAPQASASPRHPAPWRRAWPLLAAVGSLAAALLVAATFLIERPADRMVAFQKPADHTLARKAAKQIDPAPAAPAAAAPAAQPREAAAQTETVAALEARREAASEGGDMAKVAKDDAVVDKARSRASEELRRESLANSAADRAAEIEGTDLSAEGPPAGKPSSASPPRDTSPLAEAEKQVFGLSAEGGGKGAGQGGGGQRLLRAPNRYNVEAGDRSLAAARREALVEADKDRDAAASWAGEGYAAVTESRPVSPREQPLSTFSIDVDTASYANVRRFLTAGRLPPRGAVRIEELVNYFRYDYPQPEGDTPFSVTVDAAECPWNAGRRLVRIGLEGRDIDRRERPAGNLVFLIDVSGSMQDANKLPLVKQALAMLVEELSENDRVAIVTYAGNAGLALPPTKGDQKGKILAAVEALEAGGSTHGSAGIAMAYEQAREHFIPGGANRVILATDGDLNVGVTTTAALIDLIKDKARAGVFLTVLGFGEGNLQDAKMEALADNGNGVYAYIDGVREARKVLVEQLTGSTVTIAKDVKIQVEFNPAQVASYRLLGYENRALAARDFRDDQKDAGEIGAGHSVTAIYEITLVGAESGGPGIEALKYQPVAKADADTATAAVDPAVRRELLTVKLRWKRPDAQESTGIEVPLTDPGPAFQQAPADLRFAAAVAAFGMILQGSDQRGDATLPLVAKIAAGGLGRDDGGYRAEFLDLVRRAESAR